MCVCSANSACRFGDRPPDQTQRERQKSTQKQRERDRDRERQRETERETEETDRQIPEIRETEAKKHRHREMNTLVEGIWKGKR